MISQESFLKKISDKVFVRFFGISFEILSEEPILEKLDAVVLWVFFLDPHIMDFEVKRDKIGLGVLFRARVIINRF